MNVRVSPVVRWTPASVHCYSEDLVIEDTVGRSTLGHYCNLWSDQTVGIGLIALADRMGDPLNGWWT